MKKLLFLATDWKIGTASLIADELIAIAKSGVNLVALSSGKEQEPGLLNNIREEGIDLRIIPDFDEHKDFNYKVKEIIKIIEDNDIEVVHVQNNWQLAILGISKFKSKKKFEIIYTLHAFRHNSPIKSKIAQIVIGSGLLLFSNKIICMTDYLTKKFSLLKYKIIKLPLGIKDSYFIEYFIPPQIDCLRVIFPAQFRQGKNQDLIIKAFAEFVNKNKDTSSKLVLPGEGPLLDEMKSLATNLGIRSQVEFPGFVSKEDIKKLYLESNIAVVASNSETFGQSIVEPYVLGRSVVSTPVGIAPEIIKNGVNGFIFKNSSQLTNIFQDLNNDKSLLIKIGENNFENRDKFKWSEIVEEYKTKIL